MTSSNLVSISAVLTLLGLGLPWAWKSSRGGGGVFFTPRVYFFVFKVMGVDSRPGIAMRPTENDSTRLYKNGGISAVIKVHVPNFGGC